MMLQSDMVINFFLIISLAEALPKLVVSQDIMLRTYRIENNLHGKQIVKRSMSTNFGPLSTYSDTSNGNTCFVCRPGFYRTGDCSANMTVGECQKCPSGTYNKNYNIAMHCAGCTPHCMDKNAEIEKQCNSTADMECRCKDGYYNHSKGPGEWMCMLHAKCGPGTEPSPLGTSEVDTKCQQCSDGWYSSSESSTDNCLSCSVCGPGEVTQQVCNGLEDTICTSKVSDQKELFQQVGVPIIVGAVITAAVVAVGLVYLYRKKCLRRLMNKYRHERSPSEMPTSSEGKTENEHFDLVEQVADLRDLRSGNNIRPENSWTQVFNRIIGNDGINKEEWKSVIRTLFSKHYNHSEIENKLTTICIDYQGLNEQIYQSFSCWLKRGGDKAYLDDIIEALVNDNMTGLANDLKQKFPSLLRRPSSGDSIATEV